MKQHSPARYQIALATWVPTWVCWIWTPPISGTTPKSLGQLSELTHHGWTARDSQAPCRSNCGSYANFSTSASVIPSSQDLCLHEWSRWSRFGRYLGASRLAGSLPHRLLRDLSALEDLDLSETNINGTLPAELAICLRFGHWRCHEPGSVGPCSCDGRLQGWKR